MSEKKEGRILVYEDELRVELLEGAKAAFDAVAVTYGPRGKNVLIERSFGRPTFSRDGATIVEQVFFSERIKNMGAQVVIEASRSANHVSGDGSSATAILTYHLLKYGLQAIAAGKHPMEVSEIITEDSYKLLEKLKKLAIPVEDEQLSDVATVSAGNQAIGQLIADAILYVGSDGGIITEKAPLTEIEREYVDGYYLESGFQAIQTGKKELVDPYVIVSSKTLRSGADAIDLLKGSVDALGLKPGQVHRFLFIGNFEDAAYATIVENINRGVIDAIIIKTPPMYGETGKYLLEDIAIYAGCNPITGNTNLKQFNASFIGSIDKVVANKSESTLFADNQVESVRTRIEEIQDQLSGEDAPAIAEKLRNRIAKLEGKIAIFKIGAATETEKEELEYRIEDAINSTRHAYEEGIVAGGGITLLELSKLSISDIYREALRATFKQLLINANLEAELKLHEALNAPKGQGFNLRKDGKLVDMVKEGIIDAYVVPREIIFHATSMIAETIKLGLSVVFEDTEK